VRERQDLVAGSDVCIDGAAGSRRELASKQLFSRAIHGLELAA
jgi:hypothetical protein